MKRFRIYPNPFPQPEHEDNTLVLSPSSVGTWSGWTLTGKIHEDYIEWVSYFEASHPTLGQVRGDFDNTVLEATSKKALKAFCKVFSPDTVCFGDI